MNFLVRFIGFTVVTLGVGGTVHAQEKPKPTPIPEPAYAELQVKIKELDGYPDGSLKEDIG